MLKAPVACSLPLSLWDLIRCCGGSTPASACGRVLQHSACLAGNGSVAQRSDVWVLLQDPILRLACRLKENTNAFFSHFLNLFQTFPYPGVLEITHRFFISGFATDRARLAPSARRTELPGSSAAVKNSIISPLT